jgi:hypothetical protein
MECTKCKAILDVEQNGEKPFCDDCYEEPLIINKDIHKIIVNKIKRKWEFESENEKSKAAKIKLLNSESEAIRSKIIERHELLFKDLIKEKNILITRLDDLISISLKKINSKSASFLPEIIDSTVENDYKSRYPLNYVFAIENNVFKILNEIQNDSQSLKSFGFNYAFFPSTLEAKNIIGTIGPIDTIDFRPIGITAKQPGTPMKPQCGLGGYAGCFQTFG